MQAAGIVRTGYGSPLPRSPSSPRVGAFPTWPGRRDRARRDLASRTSISRGRLSVKRTNLIVLLGLVALVAGGSLVILIVRKHKTSNSTSKAAVAGGPNGTVTVVVASQPLSQGAVGD